MICAVQCLHWLLFESRMNIIVNVKGLCSTADLFD